ncbi:MAG: hypothetical protein ACFCBW_20950 [Candidatus Competibacterales bacterium]
MSTPEAPPSRDWVDPGPRGRPSSRRGGIGVHGLALALTLAVLVAWGGLVALALTQAALPPEAKGRAMAVFPVGWSKAATLAAILDAGGGVVEHTGPGNVWIVASPAPGFAQRLRQEGAWGVFNPVQGQWLATVGCFYLLP